MSEFQESKHSLEVQHRDILDRFLDDCKHSMENKFKPIDKSTPILNNANNSMEKDLCNPFWQLSINSPEENVEVDLDLFLVKDDNSSEYSFSSSMAKISSTSLKEVPPYQEFCNDSETQESDAEERKNQEEMEEERLSTIQFFESFIEQRARENQSKMCDLFEDIPAPLSREERYPPNSEVVALSHCSIGINTNLTFDKDFDVFAALALQSYMTGNKENNNEIVNNEEEEKIEISEYNLEVAEDVNEEIISLENDIDKLEIYRQGIEPFQEASLESSSCKNSLEEVSSIFSNLFSAKQETKISSNANDNVEAPLAIKVNDLPYDNPYFYKHLPPHNRDVDCKLPALRDDNFFKNEKIFISEVNSPTHFWFQHFDEFSIWGDAFQSRLNKTYKAFNEKDLKISSQSIEPGLLVAIYYRAFKEWYRAIVHKYDKKKKLAFCFSIDYGSHSAVPKKNIKFLLDEFTIYPKLCDRGRIAGLKPYNDGKFSLLQMSIFLNKIYDQVIEADVVDYDEQEEVFDLKLTLNGKDLGEWLIEKKICQRIPEGEDKTLHLPSYTHRMLENGDYPSFEKREKSKLDTQK